MKIRQQHPARLFAAALVALAAVIAAPAGAQLFPPHPDACTSALTPGTVTVTPLADGVTTVYTTPGAIAGKKVVLLVNGNCFAGYAYAELASHLARNGFATALLVRPDNAEGLSAVFDSVDAALDHFGFAVDDPDLEIALVGHSMGGRMVMDAARTNDLFGLDYPVGAIATLAPVASLYASIDGNEAPAYLSIYGSQDEDTDAYVNDGVNEAFFAYDFAGTENSTTCSSPPCLLTTPPFQKTMVFVYGMDHAGLVGQPTNTCGLVEPDLEYLAPSDMSCITKAYLTGFLRWHLWGDSAYKGMLRGQWKPASVAAIVTAEADEFNNPAGSPLRFFLQNSPEQHLAIQAFSSGLGSHSTSPGTVAQHAASLTFVDPPYSVRHKTGRAQVGWNAAAGAQWMRFAVPWGTRNGSTFTHFSLRLGQLNGVPSPYDNPDGGDQSVWLILEDDANQESWHQLNIPPPDRYAKAGPVLAQSHLSTFRIPVSAITGIDKTDIRSVYLFFNSGTHGTLMVDSLEWHRD